MTPKKSAKGVYRMHLNAFFDLSTHTYTDALIEAVYNKNEFRAFCDIVDRHDIIDGIKNVYMGDRGYCSYNNVAHVINQYQYFLFRTKDIDSKGMVGNFNFPEEESFDIWANLIAYNITEVMTKHTILEKCKTKYEYIVNFTIAAHICRVFLRLATEKGQYDVISFLQKELILIRNERRYPRLQTAHFRKPRYLIYRAA